MTDNKDSTQDQFDLDSLIADLFWELIISSYESLERAIGSDRAEKAIRPYFENCGRAGYHNIAAALEMPGSEKLLKTWLWGNHAVTRSCAKGIISRDMVTLVNHDCPLEGRIPILCLGYCQIAAEAAAREVWPECNFSQIPADDTNDHTCQWIAYVHPQDTKSMDLAVEKEAKSFLEELSAEQFNWLAHAIPGELWVIATRVMLDSLDQDKASSIMRERMTRSGAEFAKRHFGCNKSPGDDAKSLGAFIELVNQAQRQKGRFVPSEADIVVREIHECPYSDSPDLVCHQFEWFLNGICNWIDPAFEFKYSQMMTQGDQYCIWKISRKAGGKPRRSGLGTKLEGSSEEHPLMILARRLAKGEISMKEYAELKAFISSELKD